VIAAKPGVAPTGAACLVSCDTTPLQRPQPGGCTVALCLSACQGPRSKGESSCVFSPSILVFAITAGLRACSRESSVPKNIRYRSVKLSITHIFDGCTSSVNSPCGILMHSSLAVTTDGLPLGLAAIKLWTRKKFKGTNALKGKGIDGGKHSV